MITMEAVEQKRMELNVVCQNFLTNGILNGLIDPDVERYVKDLIMTDYKGSTMSWLNKFLGGPYNENLLSNHKVVANCLERAILLDYTVGQFYAELVVDLSLANS